MRVTSLTTEQINRIVEEYDNGVSMNRLASKYRISYKRLKRILIELGSKRYNAVRRQNAEKEVKICRECGRVIPLTSVFCPFCGKKCLSEAETISMLVNSILAQVIEYLPQELKAVISSDFLAIKNYIERNKGG